MNLVGRLFRRAFAWLPWFRPAVEVAPPPLALPLPAPPEEIAPTPTRPRPRKSAPITSDRAFVHLTDVLDLLPKCRELMLQMRKIDQHSYEFWKVMGAKLLPESMVIEVSAPLPPLADLPGQGMVFFSYNDWQKDDVFPGHFSYFTKLQRQPYYSVVPSWATAVFNVVSAYTDFSCRPFGYEYYVAVGDDGRMEVVSQRHSVAQRLRSGGVIHHLQWRVPHGLEWHWKDCQRRNADGPKWASAQQFGLEGFKAMLAFYLKAAEDFQVRAERAGVSVAFNVALGRTPQFFKDRETELATDGKRKRIFHAVEEHQRVYPSGKVATVPAHYRGERTFAWKGEHITITPSERSFAKTFKLVAEMAEANDPVPKDKVDLNERAPWLRGVVEREWRKRA